MSSLATEQQLCEFVEQRSDRLIEILQDLVRIPSQNTAPTGTEAGCQRYIAQLLSRLDWDPLLYSMDDVPGLKEHPWFMGGRDYANRPNLGACLRGEGGGRSLLLSGHIDTVPVGSAHWDNDPFGGTVKGNRLYGRGSNDMKGGVATNLFVIECLRALNIKLKGDLLFESVVDEEFGGANGTLAGRLKGFNADAVVLSEPSFLRICPAQRGGRMAHIILRSSGGILGDGPSGPGVVEQLSFLLVQLKQFGEQRRKQARPHPLYRDNPDPVPVTVTRIITAPWGTTEPITTPAECRVEIYWQAMPGETLENIDREFLDWTASLKTIPGSPLTGPIEVMFAGRWLPGSAISTQDPLVVEFGRCATRILGSAPVLAGIEGPCDMFLFHEVQQTPAILWGACGGNTHAPDEFIEIDSLVDAAKVLLAFVCDWCGVA